jgi:hypothetical protein
MAYCPECGAEFGVGIRRCPECRVDLLEELHDPDWEDSPEQNLVAVHDSVSSKEAGHIKTLLEKNGILCVLETMKSTQRSAQDGLVRILVNLKDEIRSRQLIQPSPMV